MKKLLLLIIPSLLLVAGCAHVLSDSSMQLVDRTITFGMLNEHPEAYIGKYVLLGGAIAGVRNTREGAWLEVVQYDLDITGTPKVAGKPGGRFLATTDAFLDPYVYASGLEVTVAGKVVGKQTWPLDAEKYTYPVIAVKEMYLHKEMRFGPDYDESPRGLYPYWGAFGGF